jgi:hypothetical protein
MVSKLETFYDPRPKSTTISTGANANDVGNESMQPRCRAFHSFAFAPNDQGMSNSNNSNINTSDSNGTSTNRTFTEAPVATAVVARAAVVPVTAADPPTTERAKADAAIAELQDGLKKAYPELAQCWDVNMFVLVCKEHKACYVSKPGTNSGSIYQHMLRKHPGSGVGTKESEEFGDVAQKLMDAKVQQWDPLSCVVGATSKNYCPKCQSYSADWSAHGAKRKCDVKVAEKRPCYKIDDGSCFSAASAAVALAASSSAEAKEDGGGKRLEDALLRAHNIGTREVQVSSFPSAAEKRRQVLLKQDLAKGIKVHDEEVNEKFRKRKRQGQVVKYEVKQHRIEQSSWYRSNVSMLAPLVPPDDFRDCPEAHGRIRETRRHEIPPQPAEPSSAAVVDAPVADEAPVFLDDEIVEEERVDDGARTRKTTPAAAQERPSKALRTSEVRGEPAPASPSQGEDRIWQNENHPVRTTHDGALARNGTARDGRLEPMLEEEPEVSAGALLSIPKANERRASETLKEQAAAGSLGEIAPEQIPDSVVSSCAPDQLRPMPDAAPSSSVPAHVGSMPDSTVSSCAPDQLRSMPDAAPSSSVPAHVGSMPDSTVSSSAPDQLRSMPDAAPSSSGTSHVGSMPDSAVSSGAPDPLRSMPDSAPSSPGPVHVGSMPESTVSSCAPDQLRSMSDSVISSGAPNHARFTSSTPALDGSVSSQEMKDDRTAKLKADGEQEKEEDESMYANVPKSISDPVMTSDPMKAKFFSTPSLVIDGAKYGAIPAGCAVIDVRNEAAYRVKLKVTLPVTEPEADLDDPVPKTTEIVIVDARSDFEGLEDLVELSSILHNFKNITEVGEGQVVQGIEYHQYDRSGTYDPAKRPCLKQCMDRVTSRVALQMRLMCPEAWEEFNVFSTLMHGPLLGKPLSIDQKVTVAECHGEAARVDPSDKSPRYTVYTKNEACPDLKNWYLLFPSLSLGDSRGVAVQLFHGAGVSWDGRHVRHGTTIPTDLDGTPLKDLPTTEDAAVPLCTAFSVVARGDVGV